MYNNSVTKQLFKLSLPRQNVNFILRSLEWRVYNVAWPAGLYLVVKLQAMLTV